MSESARFYDLDEKDTWQTPNEIVDTIQRHVDVELDPCAGLRTFIGAENWTIEEGGTVYTEGDSILRTGIDSLERAWDTGGIAYVNPPFSMKNQFIAKTIEEYEAGNIDAAIVLTPDSTDVKSWWHGQLAPVTPVVWFSRGRINFVDPDSGEQETNPTFGTALHFVGDYDQWPSAMFDDFAETGDVMVRWRHA